MFSAAELLQNLVSLPSINPMGKKAEGEEFFEYKVTAYLENYFRELGAPFEKQQVAPKRENIIARCDVPGATETLMFEVHQDTVPAENMIINPYAGNVKNGHLYGRGACDVKGGMTSMLMAFTRLFQEKPAGAKNVVLACTVDEEHTFTGISHLVDSGIRPDIAIVAEPTELNIVNAHKGVTRFSLSTQGRACHSSSPDQGINAIYRMGKVLTGLEQFADYLFNSKEDPVLGRPSISVGRIFGGSSVNIVPDSCTVEIDRRLIPEENPKEVVSEVVDFLNQKCRLNVPFECSDLTLELPALSSELSGELVQRLGNAIDSVAGKHRVEAVPYGTDAAILAKAGVPVVVFGPGDIRQAHTCDEWIALEEVEKAAEILYHFAVSG